MGLYIGESRYFVLYLGDAHVTCHCPGTPPVSIPQVKMRGQSDRGNCMHRRKAQTGEEHEE